MHITFSYIKNIPRIHVLSQINLKKKWPEKRATAVNSAQSSSVPTKQK
jgi:hypothetical protein